MGIVRRACPHGVRRRALSVPTCVRTGKSVGFQEQHPCPRSHQRQHRSGTRSSAAQLSDSSTRPSSHTCLPDLFQRQPAAQAARLGQLITRPDAGGIDRLTVPPIVLSTTVCRGRGCPVLSNFIRFARPSVVSLRSERHWAASAVASRTIRPRQRTQRLELRLRYDPNARNRRAYESVRRTSASSAPARNSGLMTRPSGPTSSPETGSRTQASDWTRAPT